jgi:hypothetical protein
MYLEIENSMRARVIPLLLGLLAAGLSPASAQEVRDHVRAGEVQPLDRILPHVKHGHPGTFYDAVGPTMGPDGRYWYRLKWMTPEGRIVWLNTDARTGRVMEGGRPFGPGPDFPPGWGPRPGWGGRVFHGGMHRGRDR